MTGSRRSLGSFRELTNFFEDNIIFSKSRNREILPVNLGSGQNLDCFRMRCTNVSCCLTRQQSMRSAVILATMVTLRLNIIIPFVFDCIGLKPPSNIQGNQLLFNWGQPGKDPPLQVHVIRLPPTGIRLPLIFSSH